MLTLGYCMLKSLEINVHAVSKASYPLAINILQIA